MKFYVNAFAFLVSLWATFASAHSIGVLYEPGSKAAAQSFQQKFVNLSPFDQVKDLKIHLIPIQEGLLNCHIGKTHRVMECNESVFKKEREFAKVDTLFVFSPVKSKEGALGTGTRGFVLVGTSDFDWFNVAVHEFMHALSFEDEYAYNEADASYYCNYMFSKLQFNPAYNLSREATGNFQYPSKVCRKKDNSPMFWQLVPESTVTIMQSLDGVIPPLYKKLILQEMARQSLAGKN